MKFYTDGMLGKLTRWLRMLGHDVEYARDMDDKELIRAVKNQERVLLTKDYELFRLAVGENVEVFLVEGTNEFEKLAAISKRFKIKLEIIAKNSRCPLCNGSLKSIDKSEIIRHLKPDTTKYYEEFWECFDCNRIYWQGAHWKKIVQTLNKTKKLLMKT